MGPGNSRPFTVTLAPAAMFSIEPTSAPMDACSGTPAFARAISLSPAGVPRINSPLRRSWLPSLVASTLFPITESSSGISLPWAYRIGIGRDASICARSTTSGFRLQPCRMAAPVYATNWNVGVVASSAACTFSVADSSMRLLTLAAPGAAGGSAAGRPRCPTHAPSPSRRHAGGPRPASPCRACCTLRRGSPCCS